jgi:hypothetical protein
VAVSPEPSELINPAPLIYTGLFVKMLLWLNFL